MLGLYNWDNSILDGLTLPDNFTNQDLLDLKNNLLLETAEFELLYPDFDFLKIAITQWCNMRKSTWKWLKDTQKYEYNPLWNENYTDNVERDLKGTLDATDVRTDALKKMTTGTETTDHSGDDTLKRSGNDTNAKTGTETAAKSGNDTKNHSGDDTQKKTGSDTTLNSVYAMNEQSNPAPESSSTVTYNSQVKNEYDSQERTTYNSQNQTTYNTQDQTTYNSQEKNEYNSQNLLTHNTSVDNTGTQTQKLDHDTTDTGTVDRTVQGLHGAFAQDAIKKEQELALFNILEFIITDFKKRFCLLVY